MYFIKANATALIELGVLVIAAVITSLSAFYFLQLAAERLKKQFDVYRAARRLMGHMNEHKKTKKRMTEWKVFRYLDFLLQSTTDATEKTTHRFIVTILTVFGTSFVILQAASIQITWGEMQAGNVFTGVLFRLVLSFVIAIMPVLYYILKLRLIRISSGYSLAQTSGILLSKYRKHNGKIYDALIETANDTKNVYIQRRLYRIVKAAQTYVDLHDLKREVDIFVFSINTTFARNMGVAILKSFTKSADIEKSLEANDQAIQLNIQMLDDEKSNNHDILQLGWIHLFVFPLSLWTVTVFMPLAHYWRYQFETDGGRFWFILSVLSVLASVFVALWFRKPPNDI